MFLVEDEEETWKNKDLDISCVLDDHEGRTKELTDGDNGDL